MHRSLRSVFDAHVESTLNLGVLGLPNLVVNALNTQTLRISYINDFNELDSCDFEVIIYHNNRAN